MRTSLTNAMEYDAIHGSMTICKLPRYADIFPGKILRLEMK